MQLWPVKQFWLTFFPDQHWICGDLEKKVSQLVKVSFFRSDFLQNPYFSIHLNYVKQNVQSIFLFPNLPYSSQNTRTVKKLY